MNSKFIEDFFEFIYDRQLIWYKKEVLLLPSPWTDNPVLGKYKFCNVYRELDRGSRYLIETVISKPLLAPEVELFNIVAYRFFNLPGTFGEIFEGLLDPYTFDFSYHEKWLDKRKSERHSIFNDAYITCSIPFDKNYRPKDKHIQVLKMLSWLSEQIKEFNFLGKVKSCKTAEESYAALKMPMTGEFLRFEIWMDLAYAGIVGFSDNDFVMPGPGSAWGLMLLEGQEAKHRDSVKINAKASSAAFLKIRDMQEEQWQLLLERTGKNWYDIAYKEAYSNVPFLSLSNIEGALCEWRKYKRLGDPAVKARKRFYHHDANKN